MLFFRELAKKNEVNETAPRASGGVLPPVYNGGGHSTLEGMARPPETFGKVAAVFGVTRQAVHKWKRNGAPFYSAEALLAWLDNREGVRVLDRFHRRCPVLLANLEQALAWPVFWP